MHENQITDAVIGRAIEVHRELGGPGLLERLYEDALAWELQDSGLIVKQQLSLPVRYKNTELGAPLIIDLLVNDKVVVECKATSEYNSIAEVQLLTYLRLSGCKVGLVINFGERMVRDGIRRVVNGLDE